MAEAIVSGVLEQLTSIIAQGIQQELKLVVGVDNEVEKLRSNLQAIEAVLVDAEERQVKEKTVSLWLDRLKHASYDIEDVLDEWNYAMLKQQIEGAEDAAVPKKELQCSILSSGRRKIMGVRRVAGRTQLMNLQLKTIEFIHMDEWEEWDYEITRNGEEEDDIAIMPSLVSLQIRYCPNLKALPNQLFQSTTLRKRISSCLLLRYHWEKKRLPKRGRMVLGE